jgi:hypothetical protein
MLVRIPVGVLVNRSAATNPWVDFIWRPVGVLAGVPETAPWTRLSEEGGVVTFYVGAAELKLFRTETANYLSNLGAVTPSVWVALRSTGVEPPYTIAVVTADPAEGESLTEAGDDLVESVPMPPAVRDIVAAFAAEHHIERPFVKRKRDRIDPQSMGRRGPLQKGRPR